MPQNCTNFHNTPAGSCQLHIKIPTPTPSDDADIGDSTAWLAQHTNGFLIMRSLKAHHGFITNSMLIRSIDTGELFVNKRFRRFAPSIPDDGTGIMLDGRFTTLHPPELLFSTLEDSCVEVTLPDEGYFPKLYGYGFPFGQPGQRRDEDPSPWDVYSLYFKHYNGGNLGNLVEMYRDRRTGAPIPEPFIWHVMEQLSRAILFLSCGVAREDLDDLLSRSRYGEEEDEEDDHPVKPGWNPIAHGAILERNVLLHFPDENDDPLTRCFPQVILEGFDKARLLGRESQHPRTVRNTAAGESSNDNATPTTWEDVQLLGDLIGRLVTPTCPGEEAGRHKSSDSCHSETPGRRTRKPEEQHPVYSTDLIGLVQAWQNRRRNKSRQPSRHIWWADLPNRKHIESANWLLRHVLPKAVEKVRQYRELHGSILLGKPDREDGNENGNRVEDVSWVMPDPALANIPFTVNNDIGQPDAALDLVKIRLRYFLGPYVPVWHHYDAGGVSGKKPVEGESKLYTIDGRQDKTEVTVGDDDEGDINWSDSGSGSSYETSDSGPRQLKQSASEASVWHRTKGRGVPPTATVLARPSPKFRTSVGMAMRPKNTSPPSRGRKPRVTRRTGVLPTRRSERIAAMKRKEPSTREQGGWVQDQDRCEGRGARRRRRR
ncbi:hypothetical protein L209DRAFT_764890 [Thermothelomyces heterothallicus CBS 203.75]